MSRSHVPARRLSAVPLLLVLSVLLLAGPGCARLFLFKGLPRWDGTVAGLPVREEVEVLRDRYGIPHIYAESEPDAMVALGFVHAQDRLWQMELFRRMAGGRLSEIAGEETIEIDHWARLVGLPQMCAELASRLDERLRPFAEAYVGGINAYLRQRRNDLPLEFRTLGFVPEPWEVRDLFAVLAFNSWLLEANFMQEWVSLAGRRHLDLAALTDVLPSHPGARLPEDAYFERLRGLRIGPLLPAMEALFGAAGGGQGRGSNNWVVAQGADGKPLLANDPHLELMVPGVWYYVHLATSEGQVAGATMPGIPGVVVGHNGHIAWGWTNVMADMVDLYVFRLDPADPDRYVVGDRTIPFEKAEEVYRLPKGEHRTRTILRTIRGPVITERCAGCDAVVAVKWYGSEPLERIDDRAGLGLIELNRARSVQEAFDAVRRIKLQSQNLVVADVDGNIGWKVFGAIPIRTGYSGRLPADGSSGEMDWAGFVPFDELPSEVNPERGWIATANHCTVADDAPHPLSYGWGAPYRHERIAQRLAALDRPTPEDFRAIQMDVHSVQADRIVPRLAAYSFSDPRARRAQELLSAWDRNVTADSAGAAVYEVFLTQWTRELLGDEMGAEIRWVERLLAGAYGAADVVLDRPESPIWDRVDTPERETPREILERALVRTVEFLEARLGKDPGTWQWGRLHRYVFAHPGARRAFEHKLLSRGPFPAPGDGNTVNAGTYVAERDRYDVLVLPSLRMIAPLGDLTRTTIAGPLGQSGQPGLPHYDDLIPVWMEGRGVPLLFTREAVERDAASRLVLAP